MQHKQASIETKDKAGLTGQELGVGGGGGGGRTASDSVSTAWWRLGVQEGLPWLGFLGRSFLWLDS